MQSIIRYLELVAKYPHAFNQNKLLPIILDSTLLEHYCKKYQTQLGVIYESSFYIFVVDLIQRSDGHYYPYSRIINPRTTNGIVIVPTYQDNFILLKQFRHGTRNYQLEFPRGYSEINVLPIDNVSKELFEEIGAHTSHIQHLGNIISDSGLNGGLVDVFLAEITQLGHLSKDEGIEDILIVSKSELKKMVESNIIKDCFTLSALLKYTCYQKGSF